MSNHMTLDPMTAAFASEVDAEMLITDCMTDEMEGLLILRFGDRDLCVALLDAIREQDAVLSSNYYWLKQADKGRMSEEYAHSMCGEVDKSADVLIRTHAVRLLEAVASVRESFGVEYNGWGLNGNRKDHLRGVQLA